MTNMYAPYFYEYELACPCGCGGGQRQMDPDFMRHLVALRKKAGFPFPVTSGYRCPKYNEQVSETGRLGPHTEGKAVDVQLSGILAHSFLKLMLSCEAIKGIGIKQKGPHESRFIHIDTCRPKINRPRPWIWTY